jgi:hypothetical protein
METFKIEVKEFLAKVVEIEAESSIEAISKINRMYKKDEIVLDYNDFVEVDFIDLNNQDTNNEKNELISDLIDYLFEDEKKHFEEFDSEPENHIYKKLLRLKQLNN